MADPPDPTRAPGAPHPSEAPALIGQDAAEAAILSALGAGRPHHAWLLTGPRGAGKATLAWRIARFLVAMPPGPAESLDVPPDHPVSRRIRAGSEPGIHVLARRYDEKAKRMPAEIRVDEVRALKSRLVLGAADGGRRAVIVDSADEMNLAAANALLKLLEEPPTGVTFLLVSHVPTRLLPTIRSRCRELRLAPLSPEHVAEILAATGHAPDPAAAILAHGSAGEAFGLAAQDGAALYADLLSLVSKAPGMDRAAMIALAEGAARRDRPERLDLVLSLIDILLSRLAKAGAGALSDVQAARGETLALERLAPDARAARAWADLQISLSERAVHARAVNLDPGALLLDTLAQIDETARGLAGRAP